jgi:protoporphyrinogen oxidase
LWDEILPDDIIERPRLSRIFYRGKFYSYPLKAFEALRNLGLLQSAACMASFALVKAFPVKNPRTFHEWVRNQFGERLFSIFFKTYTEKVWGMGCDEISADWAAQRIKGLSLGAAILDGLRRSLGRKNNTGTGDGPKTLIESFRYPRLIALAKVEIAKIGLMRAEDVSDACVVRQAKAYPVMTSNMPTTSR